MKYSIFLLYCFIFLLHFLTVSAECNCETESKSNANFDKRALKLKLVAMSSILAANFLGISLPILGKKIQSLKPENTVFLFIKAFAGGVVLATGFVHILPDAFKSLTSPCLIEHPWSDFPFFGFVAMMSSIGTMMIDMFATGYFKISHFGNNKALPLNENEEMMRGEHRGHGHGHGHVHTHASHGQAQGTFTGASSTSGLLVRHRVISQVLELGIVVHSIIIGISLGASQSAKTINPLVAALTFHQFFEGMGLGGCISQAKFKAKGVVIMVLFFTLTTPVCIAVGIGISKIYDENSSIAVITQGILNSAAAGILIYMALVDLLAAEFMDARMLGNFKLQIGSNFALLLGVCFMSLLAKWA